MCGNSSMQKQKQMTDKIFYPENIINHFVIFLMSNYDFNFVFLLCKFALYAKNFISYVFAHYFFLDLRAI